jgi:membrane-associated protease RseP (regulator of RpoE activity)
MMSPTRQATAVATNDPPPPEPPAPTADGPHGIFVPRWLLGIVVLVAVAALGFGIGRWTDDEHDGRGPDRRMAQALRPQLPGNRLPANGQLPGNGSNGGARLPQLPANGGNQAPANPAPASGAFLGVSVQDSTSPQGAQVGSVVTGGPADAVGIKAGDVITAVDGSAVTNASQLASRIQAHQSGDQISITYSRSGTPSTVRPKLGSRAASSAPVA